MFLRWLQFLGTVSLVLRAASEEIAHTVTVHVVPHTHDDVGWLKTVDQYYYGTREDIYKGGVQYILDTVVEQLVRDPDKTFIYVEIAFFKRWWEEQDNSTKAQVKGLVKGGQLEFINAGYCMNDEAGVHYTATIDQMSEGLRWLQQEVAGPGYDVTPRIAWQIDPFGHSSAHAALSAQMGLEGLFFARMHYQDYNKRKQNKDLEFTWKSLASRTSIFTHVMWDMYWAPSGFCFDTTCRDAPMVTNPKSPEFNVYQRTADMVAYLTKQASHYRSGNIMLTMGGDFCYQNAHKYFKNLDILMEYINANSSENGFKMIYSTPSRYMDAVLETIGPLQNKTDDLFPYADGPDAYWTGYFTSRPTLKGYVRNCNNVLQTCKQIEAAVGIKNEGPTSEKLRLAMGVSQHHDAVSGTSKQHVADDYAMRLAAGQTECEAVINVGLKQLSGFRHSFQSCRLLNESYCGVTQDGNFSFTVVVYNPRASYRFEYIRVPLMHPHYQLMSVATQQYIHVEFVRVSSATAALNPNALPLEAVFRAELPALGYNTYVLERSLGSSGRILPSVALPLAEDLTVESAIYKIYFDSKTGAMKKITNKLAGLAGVSDSLSQRFLEYSSSTGDETSKQASGAYIFRPLNESADDLGEPVFTNYVPGERLTEIWQSFGSWLSQVTRVYYDKLYIEVEWTVGPIPLDHGREIITRYSSSLATNQTFYTDSNGREMVERVLNKQPTWDLNVTQPIAGNYYPVNTRASLVGANGMQLTVLTDRSQGAASLGNGEVEFMLHRRILKDDHRGVAEPLNETANGRGLVARGKHWLYYSDIPSYHLHRTIGLDMFYKPTLAIATQELPEVPIWSFSGESLDINENLNVLTVQAINQTALLLRVENILSPMEGAESSVAVNLATILRGRQLASYEELGLAADRHISKIKDYAEHTQHDTATEVVLQPFQIRTFLLNYNSAVL